MKQKCSVLLLWLLLAWVTQLHAQPPNDTCATAQSIAVGVGSCNSILYTNVAATTTGNPATPPCWLPNSMSQTVWFSFVATSADIELSTNFGGTLADTQIAVYSGSCGSLTLLACQEDINTATNLLHTNVILHGLTVGNTYYIAVDGNGNATGTFGVCAQQTLPPGPVLPLQDCATAQSLCNMASISVPDGPGGVGASQEFPSCFGAPGERSSNWYSFTAATNGNLCFTINPNTNIDYDFAVYNTSSSCPGTELTCNWSPTSPITGLGCAGVQCETCLAVVAGQTYSILVDRFTAASTSGFTLDFAGTTATFASPNPTFTATTVCVGTPTQFTNTTNGNFTYSWNFGDGFTSNLENPTHTYATAGNYNVSLLVTAIPGGCQNSITQPVTVSAPPTVDAGTGTTVCSGACFTLSGSTNATGSTGVLSFNNTTNYAIPDGNLTGVSSPITVSGVTPGILAGTAIQSVCINLTHTWDSDLDIFLVSPDGTMIELSTGNGPLGNNYTNTCFTPTATNPITGGTDPFTGNWIPEQPFSNLNGHPANGNWSLFVVDDVGGDSGSILDWDLVLTNNLPPFSWSPTAGMTNANTLTPTVCPTATTTYTLTANNPGGCVTTDQVTVTVGGATTATIAYSGAAYCTTETPKTVTITGFSGGSFSSTAGLAIDPVTGTITPGSSSAGTYTVTYSIPASGGCPASTVTTSVIIRQQPNAGTDGSTSICDSNTTPINLFSLITGEQTGGIWTRSFGTGGTLNAGTGVFTPVAGMSSSSFTYTLTGISPCANDTSTVTLTVLPQANAGTDGTLSVCDSNTSPIDLFTLITGEQAGGVWTRNSGTGGTFNAAAGTYSPAPGATSSDFIYTVLGTAPCLPDTSTVAVTIVPVVTPTLNCGTSTTTSVQFNWAAVSGATGYTVSYQINANPVVNVGAIGNLLIYSVGSLSPGDNVTITVTPTGALGSCFNPATQLCTAANCVPPTANIVYGAASFCTSLTAAQTVTLTGSGAFNTGTFSAAAGLTINATTGDISPASSTPANYTVTYTIASTGGCPAVTATTPITIAAPPAIPTLTATQPTCTVATGAVTITGLTGLTYSFDGGAYSATLIYSGLAAGSSHTVTAQNAAGCISPAANTTLNAQPATPAIPTLTATQPTCTVATGTVTITGLPGLAYSFDGGAYSATLAYSGLTAGSTHTVTAQNAAGCISPAANITLNAQPATPAIPTLTATQPICTVATGTVTITALPGLTYSFDGGAYSANLVYSGLTAGSLHTVTAQNAAGCISPAANITLNTQPATPSIPTLTDTQPTCTVVTGTVTITGLPGLTYSFDGGAYTTTLVYGGLTAGSSHTVTAQNAAGCISSVANITLNAQPATPAIPTLTATQPTCTVATGTVTITGLPGLTYSFDGGAYSATLVYSGLTAGFSHTVTAQNAAGCISPVANITLNAQPTTPAIPTLTATQPTCTVATGTVTITGLPGLTYSFDGGAYSATLVYSGLTAGSSHTVTAQNAAGCVSPVASITLNAQPATPPIPTLTATQPTCTVATGTVTITGVAGLTYSFDAGPYSATLVYSGLTAGTAHTITAQNAAGCISPVANITLNAQPATPSIPTLTATQPTCTVATGTVTITGLPGLTYSFDGGAYSATLVYSGLTAGSAHTVTAQNAAGCVSPVANIALSIPLNTPATPICVITQPTCSTASGTITINGVPGEDYSFDSAPYSSVLAYSGLAAGSSHTVTARNAAGCISSIANITLNPQPVTPGIPILTAIQPSCTVATGSVSITGIAGLTYSFDGGAYSSALVYGGLAAGSSHTVTAQNAAGCISSIANITLNTQPTTPTIPILTPTQPSCTVATGTVTITGIPGLTYSFDGGAYTSTLTYSGLAAGSSHTVTAQNAAGCISPLASLTLGNLPLALAAPTAVATHPTCTVATGTITIVGIPGLVYSFDGAAYSPTLIHSGLIAGSSHSIVAQDASGCISSATTVTLNAQPATPAIPTFTMLQPTCSAATGTLTINVIAGLTYSLDGGPYSSTLIYGGLAAGSSHTLSAQNAAGCISPVANIPLNAQPATPAIPTLTATQPTCAVATGTVSITGLPGLTYSFDGGVYSTTLVYGGLVAGSSHTVTAKNPVGCISAVASITLNAQPATPAIPTLTAIQPTCTVATGTVSITGLPGLTYSFDGGAYTTTLIYSGLTAGTVHTVTAQNAAGCISPVANITLNTQPATPATPTLTVTQPTCTVATGTVTITGTTGLTYSFDGGAYTSTLSYSGLMAGSTHTVTAKNVIGCVSLVAIATLNTQPVTPVALATPVSQTICSGNPTAIALTATPGTTFTWTTSATNVSGAGSGSGSSIAQILNTTGNVSGQVVYTIVPVANGCTGLPITVTINVRPVPVGTATPASQFVCWGGTTSIGLNATLPNTTFSWTVVATGVSGASSGSGNTIAQTLFPTLDALGSVNYIVTPIADGCTGTPFNVQVRVRPKPRIVSGNNAATCDGQGIYLTPNANYPTNLYSWTVTQMNGVTGAADGTASAISQTLYLTGDSDGTVVYTIIPTYQGCIGDPFHITVTVYALPKPVLVSGNICVDPTSGNTIRSYLLDSGLNNTTHHFEWTHNGVVIPGATSSTYEATLGGDYSVIATNDQTGCVSAEVFATVTPIFVPTAMTAAGTEAFSENASIVVSVKGGTGPFFYQLANGPLQSSNVFSGLGGGTYTVKVIDEYGCTDLETEVTLIDYPKFFTPNGDGYNDYWNIFSLSGQPAEISIFDRYGKLVKQISTRGDGWDGNYNGHLLPSTDYWFTVDYTENKIPKVFRAHFSLKR